MSADAPQPELNDLRRSLERLLRPEFGALRDEILALLEKVRVLEAQQARLETRLTDPREVSEVIQLGLADALQEEVDKAPDEYSRTIAPILSSAITSQIRNARTEMITALYPIIGQTITKAISEAFQDLRRRIDSSMGQQFNLSQQLKRLKARLQGVSQADLMLREALDYRVKTIFIIHRETGLLLKQVAAQTEAEDMDIFSAMLTAIRDFARDTFGTPNEDLEAIQYGDAQILLKSGTYAYAAVVMEGVQPPGYANFLQNKIYEINLKYEKDLRTFTGEMTRFPDLGPDARLLMNPPQEIFLADQHSSALSGNQKKALVWTTFSALLALALVIFGCVFSVRLFPLAFPGPTLTPTVTLTLTATTAATAEPTKTTTPRPTDTPTGTPLPEATKVTLKGVMIGNVHVRREPSLSSPFTASPVTGHTPVEVLAVFERWAKISWIKGLKTEEGWVPLIWIGLSDPVPEALISPQP